MSFASQGLPNPFGNFSPFTFLAIPDRRFDLWSYRLLRSLQTSLSAGQLVHKPYYKPFSTLTEGYAYPPFLNSADHYFEWRSAIHHYPICIIVFSINPLHHFPNPHIVHTAHFTYHCPVIHILWWDLPRDLPNIVSELITAYDDNYQLGLTGLLPLLEQFIDSYFAPITPFPYEDQAEPLSPPTPSSPPYSPLLNPNTIPLVRQQ